MGDVRMGDFVEYVLDDDTKFPGAVRPALVVRVYTPEVVNLIVFVDGPNDYGKVFFKNGEIGLQLWRTSVKYSEEYKPRTWHERMY